MATVPNNKSPSGILSPIPFCILLRENTFKISPSLDHRESSRTIIQCCDLQTVCPEFKVSLNFFHQVIQPDSQMHLLLLFSSPSSPMLCVEITEGGICFALFRFCSKFCSKSNQIRIFGCGT